MTNLDDIADRIRNREVDSTLKMLGASEQDLLGLSAQEKETLLRKLRDRKRYEGMANMYAPEKPDHGEGR